MHENSALIANRLAYAMSACR